MDEQISEKTDGKNNKAVVFVWVLFCVMIFVWFLKKVSGGRQRLRANFTTIEDELRRVQMALDEKRARMDQEEHQQATKIRFSHVMRTQKVSVDVWKMIISMGSYVGLAFLAWIFVKLFYACFWFPNYLKKEQLKQEMEEAAKNSVIEEEKPKQREEEKQKEETATVNAADKKND